jgi:hypothetical protein
MAGRVLVARLWHELVELESRPDRILAEWAIIDLQSSEDLVRAQESSRTIPWASLGDDQSGIAAWEHSCTTPTELADGIVRVTSKPRPSSAPRELASVHARLSDYLRVATPHIPAFAKGLWGRDSGSQAWRRVLERFPDRAAVGRADRHMCRYHVCRALAPDQLTHRFANNWHDLDYVFAGLHTKHLWTGDGPMRKAASGVSEGKVNLWQQGSDHSRLVSADP